MPNIQWNQKELNNPQDSSGTTNLQNIKGTTNPIKQGYQHANLNQGLVVYYPMEKGEGRILPDAALDNIGQIKGAEWNTNTQLGENSLDLNGSSDYVNGPYGGDGKILSDQITVSMWIYGRSTTGTQTAANLWGSNRGFQFDWTRNDQTSFWIGNSSNITRATLSSQPPTNQWHHLVGTYDGSTIKLYLNYDEEQTQASHTGFNTSPNSDLELGRYTENKNNHLNGLITDFRIYNRTLSKPEIKALYNLSQPSGTQKTEDDIPGQNQGGVSYYKLDGDVGDSWGKNNGIVNGAQYVNNKVYGDNAMSFDGADDIVDLNYSDTLSNLTLSAWVYPADVGQNGYVICQFDDSESQSNRAYVLRINNGEVRFGYPVGGTHTDINGGTVENNKWQHILATYDGNYQRVYLNSKLVGVREETNGPISVNYNHSAGGTINNNRNFSGTIDDIRIYNTALTPLQIEKIFHKGTYRINREDTLQ